MPELPELLDAAVGDIPPFDPAALSARARRHRRRQVGTSAAGGVLVVGVVLAVFGVGRSDSSDDLAVRTHHGPSTVAESTTTMTTATTPLPSTSVPARTTSTDASTTSTATAPPDTLPMLPASANPGAGDFAGTLTVEPTSVHAGDAVTVDWSVRNVTDHVISPFYNPSFVRQLGPPPPNDVATVCAVLTPDGAPRDRLSLADSHGVFMHLTSELLAPGAARHFTDSYTPGAGDAGAVTCAVVILDLDHGFTDIGILARVTAIPAVTITVLPDETTTSTSTSTSSTTPTTT